MWRKRTLDKQGKWSYSDDHRGKMSTDFGPLNIFSVVNKIFFLIIVIYTEIHSVVTIIYWWTKVFKFDTNNSFCKRWDKIPDLITPLLFTPISEPKKKFAENIPNYPVLRQRSPNSFFQLKWFLRRLLCRKTRWNVLVRIHIFIPIFILFVWI